MTARRREPADQRLTVNGVNLAVEVRGDGPAVLFVHGYPLDRTIWAPPVDALDGWRRIAPDLRGMGQSDAPDLGYAWRPTPTISPALLDALGVDEVVLLRTLDGRLHRLRVRSGGGASGCAAWS